MTIWNTDTLESFCTKVTDGTHDTPKVVERGYPLIKGKDISKGFIDFDRCDHVSEADHQEIIRRSHAQQGDILFSNIGSVGDCVFINTDRPFSIKNIALIKPDASKVHARFLFYLVGSEQVKGEILAAKSGSAQPFVSLASLRRQKITMPPLPIQKKIAGVLSAYDDLIETNLKRIKLLEEMAQITYEEWFVRLRFPGFETTPINAETGLTEGFSKTNIGSLVDFEIGGGWGEDVENEVFEMPSYVIRGTDLDGLNLGTLEGVPFRFHKKSNLAPRKLQDCDIIFEVSGGSRDEGVAKTGLVTTHLLARFGDDVMCASFCKLLRLTNKKLAPLAFHHFRLLRKVGATEIFEIRGASSIINFNWQAFLKFEKILVPNEFLIDAFEEKAMQYHVAISNYAHQNALLKEARDLLLPRLMTGMIDIDDYLARNGAAAVAA